MPRTRFEGPVERAHEPDKAAGAVAKRRSAPRRGLAGCARSSGCRGRRLCAASGWGVNALAPLPGGRPLELRARLSPRSPTMRITVDVPDAQVRLLEEAARRLNVTPELLAAA